jgi:hypothetical protein
MILLVFLSQAKLGLKKRLQTGYVCLVPRDFYLTFHIGNLQVGHLVKSPDLQPLLAYDYAASGATVPMVAGFQINIEFLGKGRIGEKPSWAPWKQKDTLFGRFLFSAAGTA